jgi:cyclase
LPDLPFYLTHKSPAFKVGAVLFLRGFDMKQVTAGVYVESENSICNSSIFDTGEGVVVIDTPMLPVFAKQWAKQALEFGPIKYLINTEPHGDHVTGNCYFGGTLIAHEGVSEAIKASKISDLKGMLQMRQPGVEIPADFHFRPPDITYTEKLVFYLGKYTFNLLHMPGHTPYQTVVYVPEKRIMFTSDNISRTIPFFHQAMPDVLLKTLKEMEKLDADHVVPGHGAFGGKEIIREMYENVTVWIETVKEAIGKGWTAEESQQKLDMYKKLPSLPDEPQIKDAVKMNIGALYNYYKKK